MPATNVPWPRPSPAELPDNEVRLTSAAIRPANSGRLASMPESTTAIVAAGALLYLFTPVTYGHFSLLSPEVPDRRTRASSVTAETCLSLASISTCAPLSSTATPSIERKSLTCFLASPRTSATALAAWLPPLPCTMTLKLPAAFACAAESSGGVTYALGASSLDGLAEAPRGTRTTSARVASTAVRRLPLPQSALARTPRR